MLGDEGLAILIIVGIGRRLLYRVRTGGGDMGGVGVSGKGQRLAVGSAGELVCAGGRAAAAGRKSEV